MKYLIYYLCPNDIQRYKMQAKDEKQLALFIKMLTNEKAYGFTVTPLYDESIEVLYA